MGTGTPNAEPGRSGPSTAVIVDDVPYIVDAGPGVVRRAVAASELGISALAPALLKRLFITHLHSDHTLGYPDLIFTPWVLERDEPLVVYGPPGIKAMTDHILEAYSEDIRKRISGDEPANTVGYRVQAHEIIEGLVYQDDLVRVTAFAVQHGSWKHAFGYKFETPDRVVVISGDTTPSENLVAQARGCDILVHEVYSVEGFKTRPPVWQRYHAGAHTSSHELADLANRARPGLLVLTHLLFWGATEEDLVAEIKALYDGPVVCGKDLDVY